MHRLRFVPEARKSLLETWHYSAKHWGEEKADDYLRQVYKSCNLLAQNPRLGRKRPDIAPECRSFPVESHIIYYTIDHEGVIVIGILHARMDATAHLPMDHP